MEQNCVQVRLVIAGGAVLIFFIVGQIIPDQFIYWLRLIFLFAGVSIVQISVQMKGKWAV